MNDETVNEDLKIVYGGIRLVFFFTFISWFVAAYLSPLWMLVPNSQRRFIINFVAVDFMLSSTFWCAICHLELYVCECDQWRIEVDKNVICYRMQRPHMCAYDVV